jgi:hypothetical protein
VLANLKNRGHVPVRGDVIGDNAQPEFEGHLVVNRAGGRRASRPKELGNAANTGSLQKLTAGFGRHANISEWKSDAFHDDSAFFPMEKR